MKELIRGVTCLALALGATACEDDPSIDFGGSPTTVQLSPNVMFITSGNTKELLVRLVNDRNQAVPTSFTVSNVGAGLNVVLDTLFRPQQTIDNPVLTSPLIKTQQRYFIEADLPGGGQRTFTLTSSGLSGSPTINIEPTNTGALSATAPALGEVVTINASDAQSFDPANTEVFFVVGTDTLTAVTTAVSATSISFIPLPGSAGPAFVTDITLNFAPTLAPRRLPTPNEITVPAVVNAPTTLSTATPDAGASMTVVLGGGLRFLGNSKVLVGGVEAGILSKSADSATATIVPALNSSGAVTYTGIALNFLTAVPLDLDSDGKTITPTATFGGTTLAGGTDLANAPTIAIPTVIGLSTVLTDQGGYGTFSSCLTSLGGDTCRLYKIVVPATQTFALEGNWDTTADIGFYRLSSTGVATTTPIADGLGQSATRKESGTTGSLAAGTYFIAVVYYGVGSYGGAAQPQPGTMQVRLTRTN